MKSVNKSRIIIKILNLITTSLFIEVFKIYSNVSFSLFQLFLTNHYFKCTNNKIYK